MKNIVRLNKNDLKDIVMEAAKKLIKEGYGYVTPDGNGMTGGYWGGTKYKTYGTLPMDAVLDKLNLDDETFEYVAESLDVDYNVDAEMSSEYDESTGYGSKHSPVVTVEDADIEKKFFDDVQALQVDDNLKREIIDTAEDFVMSDDMEWNDNGDDYYDDGPDPDDYYESRRESGYYD